MDRAERLGLGVAIVAHIGLFAALSVALVARDDIPRREAVAVTLTDEIGDFASASDRAAAADYDRALEDDLEAPEPPMLEDTPLPKPDAVPQAAEERAERPVERRAEATPRRRSSRISGIMDGIGASRDTGTSAAQAPVTGADRSNIISRIVNAVRPCYNLGSLGGTAAEDIVVSLRIQPSPDGTLNRSQVSVRGTRGVNGRNREYERQMIEAARAAVLNPRCPLPPLPDELYENGWSDIVLNFIPAQLT